MRFTPPSPSSMRRLACALVVLALQACGGGGSGETNTPPPGNPPPGSSYPASSGSAQKGPLIRGSQVTVQELDAALAPTGRQYSYQVSGDLGQFVPNASYGSRWVGLSATGYYFDEVRNALSSGPVTLNAYRDLGSSGVLNVNLLTTLSYQRVQRLLATGAADFAAAEAQAEREVLAALGIGPGSYGSFGALALNGGGDGDRILAAVSALFVQGRHAGELSALLANAQAEIGTDGDLRSTTRSALRASAAVLDPAVVAQNLNQALAGSGASYSTADIARWIDADGDGVIAHHEQRVPDATPSSRQALPATLAAALVGRTVSASGGVLVHNGVEQAGAVQVAGGDTLALGPAAGLFPDGVRTVYLLDGSRPVARVDFVSGLVSIALAPAAASLPRGVAQGFTASGTFTDTRVADITTQVSWVSSQPAVASVDAATGRVQALQTGSSTITASSGSVTASASLTVTPAALVALELSPTDPAGGVGTSTPLRGQGRYTDNSVADLSTQISWSSSNPTVATVGSGSGLVSALTIGTTTITASVGAISASTTFTVSPYSGQLAASMTTPRTFHTATRLANGRVLVAGGDTGSGAPLASAEIYDPDTDRWTTTTPMITARRLHHALLLPDGRVLVLGGLGANGLLATAELYQPATQAWTAVPVSGLSGVILGASVLANGEVLVTGGVGFDPVQTSAAVYTPATGAWVTVPGLPDDGPSTHNTNRHGHSYASVTLPSGRVLVIGGVWDTELSSNATTAYDPLSRTWTVAAALTRASGYRSAATLLPSGEVVVTGGSDADLPTRYFRGTERYDAALNRWASAGDLIQARADHSATLMPDGSLLVAGGFNDSTGFQNSILGSLERLAPNASAWAAAGDLLHPRSRHTATLLGNGKVLVVGGRTPGGVTALCELRW